jgi:hypothetical protein
MENITVSTLLVSEDWSALQRASRERQWSGVSPRRRLLMRAPILLVLIASAWGVFYLRTDREIAVFAIGILGTLMLVAIQSYMVMRGARPKQTGLFLGPTRYVFSAQGVQVERPDSSGRLAWNQVAAVEDTPSHVFLWLPQNTAYVVPARDLSGGLNAAILAQRLRSFISQAEADPGSDVPTSDFSAPPATAESLPVPPRITLAQELAAALKQLVLLRADAARLVGSDGAIAALAVLALSIWLPLDWFVYDGPMQFMLEQIGGLAFVIAGALALAWILARLSVPQIEYRRVLLIVTASMFIAIAGSTAFNLFAERWFASTAALMMATAYATLYFKRALLGLTGFVQSRALLCAALATLVFVVAMDRLYINPGLWVYTGDDDVDASGGTNYQDAWRRLADLQFDQRSRIDDEVARIATHSAAGAQLYFVGFAGYGEQRVFAQEIALAARNVAQRYGATDREILLVNDRRDLEKHPLATAKALRHTLVSLGKVMDADDVLFLALSSHGDEDATLSISNAGMMPGELDATQVADALRESGIRWKVIVISACHAGSFIDALADDQTIVLTAAAADRASFGCTDDRDLTYFGEAFYRDALPTAASLRAAFDAAKASIARRETAEGIEGSNPQASYGKSIEAKLVGIEAAVPQR